MLELDETQILVTGGAGFIGCAVSQLLAERCKRFVVVDNLHPQVHTTADRPERLHPEAELIVADVTEEATWDGLLESFEPDFVIHLAAETGTAQSLSDSTRHGMVNVVGTTRMLDGFSRREIRPGRILLCSSRAVYGEGQWRHRDGLLYYPGQRSHRQLASGQWDFPDSEPVPCMAGATEPRPTSVYGATKLAQEHVLSSWCGSMNAALTVLRLQNVYGPGQSLSNSYTGIVSLFSQMARNGESIPVYEDGQITRDFVFITDVASAIAAALESDMGTLETFDVGSGTPTTIWDVAGSIAGLRGAPSPHINGRYRDGDVRHAACQIEAAVERLDWKPQWDLERGLRELQGWIDTQL